MACFENTVYASTRVFVVCAATRRNLHEPKEVFIFSARRLENGLSPVIISLVTRSDMVIVKSI